VKITNFFLSLSSSNSHSCNNNTHYDAIYVIKPDFSCHVVEYWELKNVGKNECLAVNVSGSKGQRKKLRLHPCDNSENQKWSILSDGPKPWKRIVQNSTGVCLATAGLGLGASVYPCKQRSQGEQWKFDDEKHIINRISHCMELDQKWGDMIFSDCEETNNEAFKKWEPRKLP
jgi:hypothetical protein